MRLQEAYSSEHFRKEAHQLVDQLADYLAAVQSQEVETVIPYQAPEDSLLFWQENFENGVGDAADFFDEVIKKSTHLHHPRYMGHQVSPPLPMAAMAGMLTSLLNNGMAVYEMGLVSNPLERILSELLTQKIGFGAEASGLLTSGGTLANLTALLTARATQTEVWENGHEQPLAVLVSEEAHYCIDRAARTMGMGSDGIIKIPTNARFQMRTELLEDYYQKAVQSGRKVIAVVGSACSTSTGAYDDLVAIADFCKKHQLWFHVDGAHGGAVVFSERYKPLVKGIERADSVVIDWHKMLLTPALATALLFKRNQDSFQTFHQKAQYLWANQGSQEWFNSGKRTFECTKLMMSVKIYAILKTYGEEIFTENVETLHDLSIRFAQIVNERKGFELALAPESNIVCFRFVGEGRTAEQIQTLNAAIRQKLLEEGAFYIVQTTLRDKLYLRVSLMNPLTTDADLTTLLDAIERLAMKM
ncbi:pyridoxal phosphate-dependent decarboxylase family protein [Runella limosa]|uniref:pyridoxal phosphate-dependent decarboxylase family protein n=1 Tax=Runella limosa TaxID=370978 RepID=UPI00042A0A29|nr:aminotransferase class I/II-fold pyridoxal phosphate-dependent enzyme [Runella limosa]